MGDSRPVGTPIVRRLSNTGCGNDLSKENHAQYRVVVGCLLCLSCWTRPDINFAVSELSRFVADPGETHMAAKPGPAGAGAGPSVSLRAPVPPPPPRAPPSSRRSPAAPPCLPTPTLTFRRRCGGRAALLGGARRRREKGEPGQTRRASGATARRRAGEPARAEPPSGDGRDRPPSGAGRTLEQARKGGGGGEAE
jgi:hypothetical protein